MQIKKNDTEGVKDELHLEDSLAYLIFRVNNVLSSNFRSGLGAIKISNQEWTVLSNLKSFAGHSTIGELSARTTIKQPIISRIIADMQENGLVKKVQNRKDQRVVEVKLKKKGDKLFNEISPIAVQNYETALRDIPQSDLAHMKDVLKKIQRNLGIKPR